MDRPQWQVSVNMYSTIWVLIKTRRIKIIIDKSLSMSKSRVQKFAIKVYFTFKNLLNFLYPSVPMQTR